MTCLNYKEDVGTLLYPVFNTCNYQNNHSQELEFYLYDEVGYLLSTHPHGKLDQQVTLKMGYKEGEALSMTLKKEHNKASLLSRLTNEQ